MASIGHRPTGSISQNAKAHLTQSYNELGKELSSTKVRVVGNYTLGKVIGEGAYGKVRMGTHRLTGTKVALKQIPKAMSAALTREIHFHRSLHHPHIVQLLEIIATEHTVWLVVELCPGGELFDYLLEKGRLSEPETRIVFGQLCLAVSHLHGKNIVHRDLKLENVLLDERCRVKLSDFGFIREYEKGSLLDTYCGTTGYAAPEILSNQKYTGFEVDIWSLGVIFYTLLTGTLPFDDEDDDVMRQQVIKGDFEDPEWLSTDARHLITAMLQKDTTKRPTIQGILNHAWFTSSKVSTATNDSTASLTAPIDIPSPISSVHAPLLPVAFSHPFAGEPEVPSAPSSVTSGTSSTSFVSASSDPLPPTPTTPEGSANIATFDDSTPIMQRNPSEKTLTKHNDAHTTALEALTRPYHVADTPNTPPHSPPSHRNSLPPPPLPTRTPARTKRRSVSSAISDAPSLADKTIVPSAPQDFAKLMGQPAPLLFSTALERDVLNALSALGFDTAQIVHSVLSNACDATGALWWMLRRKAELRLLEEGGNSALLMLPSDSVDSSVLPALDTRPSGDRKRSGRHKSPTDGLPVQTTPIRPEFAIVPATPTVSAGVQLASTPPRAVSPTTPFLSPGLSSSALTLSAPSTPGHSKIDSKDKDAGSKGRSNSKRNRSGSVSIMQRATTALEAAGIVRKKSSEIIKEDKDKDKEKEESSRSSYASSSKLTKSPPLKAIKDALMGSTTSLDMDLPKPGLSAEIGSPWVLTGSKRGTTSPTPSSSLHTPVGSQDDTLTSLPNVGEHKTRNRASLLSAFRMWFDQDRKGKRKSSAIGQSPIDPRAAGYSRSISSPGLMTSGSRKGTMKRRTSGGPGSVVGSRPVGRPRLSASSRRSSSVNSRRSSITSVQMMLLDSPSQYDHMPMISRQRSDASRHSRGSRTPNSERGDYPSRPSSVRSFYHKHRKSPSASSVNSQNRASPMPKHHRRGSGSSTRVIKTMQSPPNKSKANRPMHTRSSSAASIQSLSSSRPASIYELSESEGGSRRPASRRSFDDTPRRSAAFAAHKKHGGAIMHGRSSWKKSWGTEPPGWGSRATHLPLEVIAVSPFIGEGPVSVRDVFSGRQSTTVADDSDWVDEDDDVPFAGGLGQLASSSSSPGALGTGSGAGTTASLSSFTKPEAYVLSAPPKGKAATRPGAKRNKSSGGPSGKTNVSQSGRISPVQEVVHEALEMRATRRQPTGRAGSSYRAPVIQEEDEEEED